MENPSGERPGLRIIWIHLGCGRWEAAVHVVGALQGGVESVHSRHAARAATTGTSISLMAFSLALVIVQIVTRASEPLVQYLATNQCRIAVVGSESTMLIIG
jgi:hypothetical protein